MMDILMILILVLCFGSIKILTDWCNRQIRTPGRPERENENKVEAR